MMKLEEAIEKVKASKNCSYDVDVILAVMDGVKRGDLEVKKRNDFETVESMFTKEFHLKYGDVDIINDVTDEWAPAFCGLLLTDEGRRHFEKALSLGLNMIKTDYLYAEILVDDHVPGSRKWEENWEAARELFEAAAGYCTCEEWDAWFEFIDGD